MKLAEPVAVHASSAVGLVDEHHVLEEPAHAQRLTPHDVVVSEPVAELAAHHHLACFVEAVQHRIGPAHRLASKPPRPRSLAPLFIPKRLEPLPRRTHGPQAHSLTLASASSR